MPGRGQDSLGVKSAALQGLGASLDFATHQWTILGKLLKLSESVLSCFHLKHRRCDISAEHD